jgi:hypothetical protein
LHHVFVLQRTPATQPIMVVLIAFLQFPGAKFVIMFQSNGKSAIAISIYFLLFVRKAINVLLCATLNSNNMLLSLRRCQPIPTLFLQLSRELLQPTKILGPSPNQGRETFYCFSRFSFLKITLTHSLTCHG